MIHHAIKNNKDKCFTISQDYERYWITVDLHITGMDFKKELEDGKIDN